MKFITVIVLTTLIATGFVSCLECLSGFETSCGVACNVVAVDTVFDDNDTQPENLMWIDFDTGCEFTDLILRNSSDRDEGHGTGPVLCDIKINDLSISSNCSIISTIVSQISPTTFRERNSILRSVNFESNDVFARVYNGHSTYDYQRNISIILTPLDMCMLGYCKDCPTRTMYASCQANNFGFWRSVLVIIGIISLLLCLPWLYPLFRMCGCVCCACCCCCRGPCIKRYERRSVIFTSFPESGIANDLELQTSETFELDDIPSSEDGGILMTGPDQTTVVPPKNEDVKRREEDMVPMTRNARGKSIGQKTVRYTLMLVCLFSLLSGAHASGCQGVITSQSLIPSCLRYNSTHEICSVRPSITATLPTVGSKACVDLKYNGTKIGIMEIHFSALSVHTSLVKQYWTSDWDLSVQAVRRCRGASGAGCNRYSSPRGCMNCAGQLNPCNQLPGGNIFNYPGVSGCIDGPTCSCAAGSGNACQNYRYSFIPKGMIYQVLSPTSTNMLASLSTILTINESTTRAFTSSAAVISVPEGTYTFNSLFTSLTPNYDTRSVVADSSGSQAWLVNAALPQVASANVIGDIQSGTESGLRSPTSGSFIFASDIVKLTAQCDGLTVTKQQPGITKLGFYPKFPTTWAGMNFTYDGVSGVLRSPYSSPSTATVSFVSNRNYTFISSLDVVVPTGLTFIEGGGCFSCPLGSWLKFGARSEGMDGTCSVSTSIGQVLTTTISLTSSYKTYNVSSDFGVSTPQGDLIVTCNGGSATARFNLTLFDYNTISPNAPATDDWYVGGGPKGGVKIKIPWSLNNLFGLGSVFSAFFWAGVAILCLIALFFIVLKLASCGSWKGKTIPEKVGSIFKPKPKVAPEEVPLNQ